MKLNLGIDVKPQIVKINAQLETGKLLEVEKMLKNSKMFLHGHKKYKDMKGIALELAKKKINWTYYTIGTLGQVYIKSKLCYTNQSIYR